MMRSMQDKRRDEAAGARRTAIAVAMGKRLSAAKQARGVSLSYLYREARVASGNWNRIEKGERLIDLVTIERICSALNISPAWAAFGHGEMEIMPDGEQKPVWPGACLELQQAIRFARVCGAREEVIASVVDRFGLSYDQPQSFFSVCMAESLALRVSERASKPPTPPRPETAIFRETIGSSLQASRSEAKARR